jgi:hypothetical protein
VQRSGSYVDAKKHVVLKTITLSGPMFRPMGGVAAPDGKTIGTIQERLAPLTQDPLYDIACLPDRHSADLPGWTPGLPPAQRASLYPANARVEPIAREAHISSARGQPRASILSPVS